MTEKRKFDDAPVAVWPLPSVHSMGFMLLDPVWSQRMHSTKTSIELVHVLKGTLTLVLPNRRVTAGPGDTLLVPTGMLHRDDFDARRGLEIFLVFFDWPAEKEFFRKVDPASLTELPVSVKTEIRLIVDRLRADLSGDAGADRLVASARLLTALSLIWRQAEERKKGPAARQAAGYRGRRRRLLMRRAREYLERHYTEPVSLDAIAAALGVSPFHLSHVFNEESDFSLVAYLTSLRMERARALLAEGRQSVGEVARQVGYDNGHYFSRVYRRYFGRPPRESVGPG